MNSTTFNAMHNATKQKQVLTIRRAGTGKYRAGETVKKPYIFSKSDDEIQKELFESDFMKRYLERKKEMEVK